MGRRGPRGNGGMGGGGSGGSGGRGGHNAAYGPAAASTPPPVVEKHPPVKGPSPGYISVACQYIQEQQLRQRQRENLCDPAREDSYRLQGVQLIDSVREALQLPVKTFATACAYYHKFRLDFRDAEYNFQDAALAALFVACKVEDTIKKSRDVLCAAYNLKNPEKPTTPDDKIFERPSTIIVGLDRLILQTVGFDFRVRYPQKLLVKLTRQLIPAEDVKAFLEVAYPMSIDLYKTFAPIKQTSFTMAISVLELAARVLGKHVDTVMGIDLKVYHTNRNCIVETLLDLLDLYTLFPKSTKIGLRVEHGKFIGIKIQINQEVEGGYLNRYDCWCDKCDKGDSGDTAKTPGSNTSSVTLSSLSNVPKPSQKRQEGTQRFVFSEESMREEREKMAEYFAEEYEEYEVEVEEPEQPLNLYGSHGNNNHNGNHSSQSNMSRGGQGPRRDRGHSNHSNRGHQSGSNSESSWAPYHRNRNQEHQRHKPRKGGYYQ